MYSLPVDVNPLLRGPEATFIPDEGTPVVYPQVADAAAQLEAMRAICYQLLQILDTPYDVSNAAQLRGHQDLRDSAISETHSQLEMVRVACYQLLQVLESPFNVSKAAPLGEHQVLRDPTISGLYPQPKSVWVAYHQLLQVYRSAIQLGEHQVHRYIAISEVFPQVALAATHVKFVLAACYRLLQIYGMLPGGNNAAQLGEYQVLGDSACRVEPPVPEAVQPTDAQEARASVGGDTSGRLHCCYEDCKATFGRLQERKRHLIDVHGRRCQCPSPSCHYKWSRPSKIKTHLIVNHKDELPQEVLNEIRAKRGRHLVAFLNTTL
ncbi:hypothetical protein BJY52DRAFT_1187739 [Lactarius psammicola]|nr:hypothetical protein BJY52DRAFT_1187739 [Lactarius psammicola]